MSDEHDMDWSPKKRERLGDQFSLLGRIGFYIQLALLLAPLVLGVYMFAMRRAGLLGANALGVGSYISFGSLLIMLFTTYWFYRYVRLGDRIKDPTRFPPQSTVITTLWVGFWAGWLGITFSMLLLLAAAWRILFVLLANPQSGMLVAPTLGTNPGYSISALDAVSLTLLVISLGVELMVLGLTLWLLFRTTWPSPAKPSESAAMLAQ
jgi:hypothetical protein